jgi:hypothetical protein
VVHSLQHPVLIEWNSIKNIQGVIDSRTDTVTFHGSKVRKFPQVKRAYAATVSSAQVPEQVIEPEMKAVSEEFPEVIAVNPKKPKITHLIDFKVEVTSDKPKFVPPRRMHPDKQSAVDAEVEEMRRNGIVSPVQFPECGFPSKVVRKSDGSNRLVTDFRRLNDVTTKIQFNPFSMYVKFFSTWRKRICPSSFQNAFSSSPKSLYRSCDQQQWDIC